MTCRKAREFLAQHEVPVQEREIFQQPLSEHELRAILGTRSPRELFAWKSVKAREQGLADQSLSDDQLLQLMLHEPTFIRRPLIVADGEWIAGFNPKQGEDLLG